MANSDKNIRITTSKNKTTYPNIVFTGSAAGSSVITLEVLDDNTLSFTSNEGQVFSIDSNLSTGTIWAVSDISGIPLLSASAGGTIGLGVYGGIVAIGQTNPTYKLDLKGSFGLASSNDGLYNFIFSNNAASGSNNLQVRSANSILFYNSGNTYYTGFKSNAAANVTYTLPTTDGSADQFLKTNGSGVLSWGTPTGGSGGGSTGVGPGAQYEVAVYPGTGSSVLGYSSLKNNFDTGVVSISHTTASTNFGNGALTVSGGVGIGGSLFVGGIGASICGVSISNSIINRGTWNGTLISTVYGGTGLNLTGLSGVLTVSSGTVSASTTSSAIASALSDETGTGSLVFNTSPSFGTSVVTSDTTFAVFNTNATTINAFGAATKINLGISSSTASTVEMFGSVSSNYLIMNTGSTGVLRIQTDVANSRVRMFENMTTSGTLGFFGTSGGTLYLGTDNGTNNGDIAIRGNFTNGGGGNVRAANFTISTATSNGSGAGGTIIFQTSTSGNATANLSNAYRTRMRIEGAATGTSNLESIIIFGDDASGTAFTSTLRGSNATGTNVNAGELIIQAARSTGTGTMAGICFNVASPGTSGSALNDVIDVGHFYSVQNSTSTSTGSFVVKGGLGITGNAFIGGTTVLSNAASSISITSGALTIAGGVGIGGSLYTASSVASNISGIVLNNGIITSGTWAGSTITSLYGGTGFNSYSVGDLLVASTGTSLARLAASSNSGYVLTSTGANSVPTWQAVPPAAASSVAVLPTTVNSQFSITVVSTASGTGIGLSTVASLVINPSTGLVSLSGLAVTANTATTSTTTGALTVAGGAGIANSAFIGGMLRVGNNTFAKSFSVGDIALDNGSTADTPALTYYWGDNRNFGTDVYSDGVGSTRYRIVYNLNEAGGREVFTVDASANLRLYSSTTGNYFGLRFTGVATTTYTLPGYTPVGTAVSVLSSDPTGIMTWIGIPSGGGSGSVNSGTGGSFAFYAVDGTAVSGSSLITTSGNGVTIGSNVNASSTTSAALLVRGGIAITGNAFIGGTTTITSTTSSISITSGALTVAGGVGIGGSLFTATSVASSISGVILSNNTVNKVTITAPASSATLTLADGSTLATSGANSLTLTTTGPTTVTLPTSGTLVNSTVTSLGSLTTASSLNSVGTITSGTWAATAITALYGGTGFNSYTVGDLLVASTGTSLAKLSAGTQNFVLTSNGPSTIPTWQAVPASAASSVAVRETVLFQPFYPTFVSSSTGTGLGLSTVLTMFVNPATGILSATGFSAGIAITIQGSSPAVSTSSGALVVVGGVGIGGSLFVASASRFSSSTDSASTGTGAIVVSGGLGLAGNAFIGGTVNITNSTVSSNSISGALVVTGGVGVGGSLFVGGIGASIVGVTFSNSAITRGSWNATLIAPQYGGTGLNNSSATGLLQFSSGTASVINTSSSLATIISDPTGTAGKLVFSTSPTFTTSVATDSATFAVFNTTATTINAFGAANTISLGAATGTITVNSTNNTSSTNTGALVVSGGVGIGKSASIAGSLLLFNGANYSGFRYTGTAITTYTLPLDSPKSSIGTSVLSSTVDGVMSWVGMSAGGSGSPAGSNREIQFNNSGNFAGATGMTWENSTYLLQLNSLNQATAIALALRLENGLSTSGGQSTRWSPALEFVARNGITNQYRNRFTAEVVPVGPDDYRSYLRFKYSLDTGSASYNNNIFLIHSTLGIGIGASNTSFNNAIYLRAPSGLATDQQYVLPLLLPSTGGFGSSVLSSDTSGNMTWVGMAAGGSGSGSVNSGTAGSVAVYLADGTAVSGTSLLTIAGAGVTIGSNLNSSSTVAAALSVRGGIGITGNAYIGGTTNITSTAPSFSTTSGALVVSGGAAVGGTLSVGNMVKVGTLAYSASNVLGVFQSSVNSYNQVIVQNTNSGASASADFVLNNDLSNDTIYYGNLGMNSSNFSGTGSLALPSAVYLSSTTSDLVIGTTTANAIRFVVNAGASDVFSVASSGTAVSFFQPIDIRSGNNIRLWNAGNTFYTNFGSGNVTQNYDLLTPTAPVGAGLSVIMVNSSGQMFFAPVVGIGVSPVGSNIPQLRRRRTLTMQFAAGYTPAAAGPDNVVLKIPDSALDGTTDVTFVLKEIDIRVETPSSGASRIMLERYNGTGAFAYASVGSSLIAGLGLTIQGAGIYFTSTTNFAAGALVTSNDKLRLNWTLLNATHANFSVQVTMEQV